MLHLSESFCDFLFYSGVLKFHDLGHGVEIFISFTLLDMLREFSIYMVTFGGLFSRVLTLWSFPLAAEFQEAGWRKELRISEFKKRILP